MCVCAHVQLEAQADEAAGRLVEEAVNAALALGTEQLRAAAVSSAGREELLQVGSEVAAAVWAGERRALQALVERASAEVTAQAQAAQLAEVHSTTAARPHAGPSRFSLPYCINMMMAVGLILSGVYVWFSAVVAPHFAAKERLHGARVRGLEVGGCVCVCMFETVLATQSLRLHYILCTCSSHVAWLTVGVGNRQQ